MYNPFDVAKDIVFDLLDLGDEVLKKVYDEQAIKNKVMIFVKKYGLMGLISKALYLLQTKMKFILELLNVILQL